jgi:hypothetical protein
MQHLKYTFKKRNYELHVKKLGEIIGTKTHRRRLKSVDYPNQHMFDLKV